MVDLEAQVWLFCNVPIVIFMSSFHFLLSFVQESWFQRAIGPKSDSFAFKHLLCLTKSLHHDGGETAGGVWAWDNCVTLIVTKKAAYIHPLKCSRICWPKKSYFELCGHSLSRGQPTDGAMQSLNQVFAWLTRIIRCQLDEKDRRLPSSFAFSAFVDLKNLAQLYLWSPSV